MLLNRSLYALFVAMLALSPLLSLKLSEMFSEKLSILGFLWAGLALSLPVTLVAAKFVGEKAYVDYWAYLESSSGSTQTKITMMWAAATAIAILIGVGSIWGDY